eukprot:g6306.t1
MARQVSVGAGLDLPPITTTPTDHSKGRLFKSPTRTPSSSHGRARRRRPSASAAEIGAPSSPDSSLSATGSPWSLMRPQSRQDLRRIEGAVLNGRTPVSRVEASHLNAMLDELSRNLREEQLHAAKGVGAGISVGAHASSAPPSLPGALSSVPAGPDTAYDRSVSGRLAETGGSATDAKQRAYDLVLTSLLRQARGKLAGVAEAVEARRREVLGPLQREVTALRARVSLLEKERDGALEQVHALSDLTPAMLKRKLRAREEAVRAEGAAELETAKKKWVALLLGNDEAAHRRFDEAAAEAQAEVARLRADLRAEEVRRLTSVGVAVQCEPLERALEDEVLTDMELARRVQYMLQSRTQFMDAAGLEAVFARYDQDFSGKLDENELQAACRNIRGLDKLASDDVSALMHRLQDIGIAGPDPDHDGRMGPAPVVVRYQSFVRFVRHGRHGTVMEDASTQTGFDRAGFDEGMGAHAALLRVTNAVCDKASAEAAQVEALRRLAEEEDAKRAKKKKKGKKKGKKK